MLLIVLVNDMQVLNLIHATFVTMLLVKKRFSLLSQQIQAYCLQDSIELAEVMIKLGMKDKSKFKGKYFLLLNSD